MLSSEVGAVQPTAVTSRSQSRVSPSDSSTPVTAEALPRARTTSVPLRASITRTTSTPARSKSPAAAGPWSLALNTIAFSPGHTECMLTKRRTAPEVITPGLSLPANT